MNILGLVGTRLSNGIVIKDDLKTDELKVGVTTFEFYMEFNDQKRKQAETWAEVGNYILRKNGNECEFYTIIESECNVEKKELYVYAEDAGLDLLNEVVGAYDADKAYPIDYYINKFAYDSGFEIGINEVSDLSRKLKWEGEQTATERILSVATQFDNAEIGYSFAVDHLSVSHKYINIYKRRGNSSGIELRMNRDLDNIITKKSVANLATALTVTGGTPEGAETPITLNGFAYDDGDIYLSGTLLKSRKSLQKWSRYLSESGSDEGHIVVPYSYDTTSQSELCNRAVSKLKKICDMEVNYEVNIAILPEETRIGDTVNIVDDTGELYLTARVLKFEVSVSNGSKKATLGDYLIRSSGVSEKLEDLAEQFKNIAQNRQFYTWIAYADDKYGTGISLEPDGKKYLGTAVNQPVKEPSIMNPFVYEWVLIKGEDSVSVKVYSVNGTVFKNTGVATTMLVTVYVGEHVIDTSSKLREHFGDQAKIIWKSKQIGELEYTQIPEDDPRMSDGGFIFGVTPDDVYMRLTFNCCLDY
ncbi:MAG: hypothetical protein PHS82_06170 [Lachnospiraceae bacterium]|nr:hypothetical protein [Lachnospiraceae bacterium]